MNRTPQLLAAVIVLALTFAQNSGAQDLTFNNYRGAMSAGAGLYNSGNLAASKPAFEAAVELASTEREKNDAYSPLVKVYAETGEYEKMFAAAEYIIENATYDAKASLTMRSLLSNCQRKNQLQAYQKRYEDRLAKDANDRTALKLLAEYYHLASRDFGKRAEYLLQLVDLDKEEKKDPDPELMFDLAFAYKLARDNEQAADLFERTAKLDKDLETSALMEAAEAWQRAGQTDKALANAEKAHEAGPDKKAKLSVYRWHRTLGEVFLAAKKKEQALEQLKAAEENAPIDAYKKQCAELIDKAKAL